MKQTQLWVVGPHNSPQYAIASMYSSGLSVYNDVVVSLHGKIPINN